MDKWGGNIGVSEQTVKRNIGRVTKIKLQQFILSGLCNSQKTVSSPINIARKSNLGSIHLISNFLPFSFSFSPVSSFFFRFFLHIFFPKCLFDHFSAG
jgi:hypothetical protein